MPDNPISVIDKEPDDETIMKGYLLTGHHMLKSSLAKVTDLVAFDIHFSTNMPELTTKNNRNWIFV